MDKTQFGRANEQLATPYESLQQRLKVETLLSTLSAHFVNMPADRIDSEIEDAQHGICELLDLDRCTLWQFCEGTPGTMQLTHWHQPSLSLSPAKQMRARLFFPWTEQKILDGETIIVSKMADLPPEASRDRENYSLYGTRATVVVPLSVGGGPVFGCISFAITREERCWPETVVKGLQLIAHVFANALARKEAEKSLQERLQFEMLLADISARFVNIPSDQIDGEIEDAQRRICECLGLDLSALWQWSVEKPESLTMSHIYRSMEGPPVPEPMNAQEHFPWCMQELKAGRIIAVSSMDELPAEAVRDQEMWRYFGVKTSLTFPLAVGDGPPIGAMSFNTMRAERTWPKAIIKRLQLVAQIFANALARKRVDRELRESEARLSMATTAAGAGLWNMDCDTGQVWASPKTRELFRFAPGEELNLERFLNVIHPEDREHVRDIVLESIEKREPLSVEYRIVHPDGSIRWIVARGRPYFGASGLPEHLMGVCIDVTEHKMAELQLSESQTLLSALVDSTSDLIWSVDAEHFGLLTFNRGLYEYFLSQRGIPIEAGMRPEDLFPPGEFVEKWHGFYRKALDEGSFTIEYLVYAGARTLRLNLNRLERDDTVFGVSVFGRDITERIRAEKAVRESEGRYRRLYESMMDGYVMAGMDGTIQAFNSSFREMTGYPPEELRELTYCDITPERWHDIERSVIEEQVLIRGYSEIYEKEYRKKDGVVFSVELRAFLLKDEMGSNIGLWAIVRDITSRKLAESEARKLREELAHVTRVLTLGELTSALAHEINQPLAAIMSNAGAAQRFLSQAKPDFSEVREILDDIIRDDQRACEVVSRVRALVKKGEPCHEPLNLNELIQQVVDLIRGDSLLQGLSIGTDLSPGLAKICGDGVQLQQVILNLILNGAAAMGDAPPDQRKIIVRTAMPDDRTVKASVTDFGTGIDELHINRLFEPFYTTKPQGLGMGLSISQTIIMAHGGTMEASNNQEGGATFAFTLHAHQEAQPRRRKEALCSRPW
jgi:PAS domain S-box-containing protein